MKKSITLLIAICLSTSIFSQSSVNDKKKLKNETKRRNNNRENSRKQRVLY